MWALVCDAFSALNWLDAGGRQQPHAKVGEQHLCDLPPAQLRTAKFLVREARSLAGARREFPLTGAGALTSLLRTTVRETSSFKVNSISPHVPLVAAAVDEPKHPDVVPMLQALPPE